MKIAIIADTHVNPTDDESSSVYKVHANANGRVLSVVRKINSMDVDAVVHLGDFVHRIQGQPLRREALARFREIMSELNAPLFLAPGNHDEGEKVTPWAPGHPTSDAMLAEYRATFGKDFYAKDLADVRLIVLNSQLLGRMDAEEDAQLEMLLAALDTEKRKFVFMHHPFYLENPGEREHYDNLPVEVRQKYLPLLTSGGVEAVFAGHVHNYFLNVLGETKFFVVPSTTFVRHDYTELFPFVPQDEAHGRNYASKLGFFLLDTDLGRSAATWIRTFGHTDAETAARDIAVPAISLLKGDRSAVGVDLRHDWATPRPVPYTALQDEFNRKSIRNDYFTASIIEHGISLLRVPIQDLEEAGSRARMHDLAQLGVRFIIFLYEAPRPSEVPLLNAAHGIIKAVEVCTPIHRFDHVSDALRKSGLDRRLRLVFSQMGTSAAGTEAMAHYIWTGFDGTRAELQQHLEVVRSRGYGGAVVRLERSQATAGWFATLAEEAAASGCRLIVYVRLASVNGAEAILDDLATAWIAAIAEIMARAYAEHITVVFDTYSDHDRGYYPRTGLVDRAYDPRPAGTAIARLTALLGQAKLDRVAVTDDAICFSANGSHWRLSLNVAEGQDSTDEQARHELCRPGAAVGATGNAAGPRPTPAAPVLMRMSGP